MDLKIRNLAKTYPNGVVALDDVSLDIPTGMFGLLGPNGAGKSTLMRTLATLQQADHGAASLGDIDILTEKNRIKPLLGYGALRIVEVPHIKSFGSIAFSLPTVFSWTESAGFLYDIEASNNFDFVFSTSAHEMAHQWWAHYVMPAHVEGIGLMGEHKQDYLYYSKGVLAMYTLKEYIGEEAVNTALRHIVNEFGHQGKRKVTSLDLVAALRKVTPANLQYLVTDLFETITLHDNRALTATYTKYQDGTYKVNLTVSSRKLRADGLGNETEIPLADLIDIAVLGENGPLYQQKVDMTQTEQSFEIVVKEQPLQAGIDPDCLLIDRNIKDNLIELSQATPEVADSRSSVVSRSYSGQRHTQNTQ